MPTMTEAPTQSKVQTRQIDRDSSPLSQNKAFDNIMRGQRWDPKEHPYMYSTIYGDENWRSKAGAVLITVGKVDSAFRKLLGWANQLIGFLDLTNQGWDAKRSELNDSIKHAVTYGAMSRSGKFHTQREQEKLDQLITEALKERNKKGQRALNNRFTEKLMETSENPHNYPDINAARKMAAKSPVQREDRVLKADLRSTLGLIQQIESIFNNSRDPEVKADVAAMDNRPLPTERELKEPQLLFPDRTNERGREMGR